MRLSLKSLAGQDPIPAGPYAVALVKAVAKDFDSGSFGFQAQFKVLEGEQEGRNVFENFVVLDATGQLSGAAFRFAQCLIACIKDDQMDLEITDRQECENMLQACLNIPVKVQVEIDTTGALGPRNRITAYEPL